MERKVDSRKLQATGATHPIYPWLFALEAPFDCTVFQWEFMKDVDIIHCFCRTILVLHSARLVCVLWSTALSHGFACLI